MRHFFLTLLLALVTTGCGHKHSGNVASMYELNRALSAVASRSGDAPPTTDEVAKFLAVGGKSMPVPPPGKKLVIDPTLHQFVLVDQ